MKHTDKILLSIFVIFVFMSCNLYDNKSEYVLKEPGIIPNPVHYEKKEGYFQVKHDTRIVAHFNNPELKRLAEYMADRISSASRMTIQTTDVSNSEDNNVIILRKNYNAELGSEGYRLTATENQAVIDASQLPGLFYGIQAFIQMLPHEIYNMNKTPGIRWQIPAVTIVDKPKYRYRGIELDVATHYFDKNELFRTIDILAMHRINYLQLKFATHNHWRIEMPAYPHLTDGCTDSLFYTPNNIAEIVRYAAKQFITVIPVFDLSGDFSSVSKHIEDINCTDETGVEYHNLCPASDNTYRFIEDLVAQLNQLFHSEYINFGFTYNNSEVWNKCENCSKAIASKGLTDTEGLFRYYVRRCESILLKYNKKLMGFDALSQTRLDKSVVVLAKDSKKTVIDIIRKNQKVIAAYNSHFALEKYQGLKEVEPEAVDGYIPNEKLYRFSIKPSGLPIEKVQNLIGISASLSTEKISTQDELEYMLLPRLSAFAEIGWLGNQRKSWDEFKIRIIKQYRRYQNAKYNFHIPPPIFISGNHNFVDTTTIRMVNPLGFGKIYYRDNGDEPSKAANTYIGPIEIDETTTINAKVYNYTGRGSNNAISRYFKLDDAESEFLHGLRYKYYDKNFSQAIDKIENTEPINEGIMYDFNINKIDLAPKNYTIVFEGFISIDEKAVYRFYTTSNDRSVLSINEQTVVDNKGATPYNESSGEIELTKGLHPMRFIYCEKNNGQSIGLYYSSKKMNRKPLPFSGLFYKKEQ